MKRYFKNIIICIIWLIKQIVILLLRLKNVVSDGLYGRRKKKMDAAKEFETTQRIKEVKEVEQMEKMMDMDQVD